VGETGTQKEAMVFKEADQAFTATKKRDQENIIETPDRKDSPKHTGIGARRLSPSSHAQCFSICTQTKDKRANRQPTQRNLSNEPKVVEEKKTDDLER
jgi:hypothetical protein